MRFGLATTLDRLAAWGRRRSTWPFAATGACCAAALLDEAAALESGGLDAPRLDPAHADVLIVAARVSIVAAPDLVRLHASTPPGTPVIALGACAASGGPWDTYAAVQGVDSLIPVDAWVPGCPPDPRSLARVIDELRAAR